MLACAEAIGELDSLAALAEAGVDQRWVRPEVTAGLRLVIEGGRHPMVEASVGFDRFVANDTLLDPDDGQVVVLTGPNMPGKSTYLRQVALIVLLAQCGSLVPATQASVGVADPIFTRVGAHDDLAARMSTFIVELTETASILNHATRAPLDVPDERGGRSGGWAGR